MKIKVCGMRDSQNIRELVELEPDYIGFIFYPKSKRFVGNDWDESIAQIIPKNIKKTGVFVNSTLEEIKTKVTHYKLNAVQLHGDESTGLCLQVKDLDVEVIKAFPILNSDDFEKTNQYVDVVDYFLFDTKTESYGGSGKKFDWEILENYNQKKPFFLSGGISVDDAETISKLNHPLLYSLDINSKFEIEPALKDIKQVKQFIKNIQNGISSR